MFRRENNCPRILAITFDLYMYNDSREGHMDLAHLKCCCPYFACTHAVGDVVMLCRYYEDTVSAHTQCLRAGSVKCAQVFWRKKKCSLCSVKTTHHEELEMEVWFHSTRR